MNLTSKSVRTGEEPYIQTGFLQFDVKTKKVFQRFANFRSEKEHFTHGMYITALIRPANVKNSKRSCAMKE